MSEAGIVDFAALDAGAVGAEVDASSDSSSTEVETQAIDSQVEGNEAEGSEGTEDSTEQSSDRTGKQSSDRTGNAEVVAEPKHISEALKALKADPNNSGAAKVLRDSYFGKQAYDKEFGSVSAA